MNNPISTYKDFNDLVLGFPQKNRLRLSLPWDLLTIAQQLKFKLSQEKANDFTSINNLIDDINKK